SFHFHGGIVPHDLLLASGEGAMVRSSLGVALLVLRPRLADVVVKMPRGAQVIYPKDIGAILVQADIAPGVRVLEAGSGSGALSLALARAVGHEGRLVSYEIRPDFHQKALDNVEAFFGAVPP